MQTDEFHVFDTTLRDGAQREGITYSVADKLAVARLLDEFGVGFIEGGWPGALPKDTEFFARAADGELALRHAKLVAFGSTRKAGVKVEDDRQVLARYRLVQTPDEALSPLPSLLPNALAGGADLFAAQPTVHWRDLGLKTLRSLGALRALSAGAPERRCA